MRHQSLFLVAKEQRNYEIHGTKKNQCNNIRVFNNTFRILQENIKIPCNTTMHEKSTEKAKCQCCGDEIISFGSGSAGAQIRIEAPAPAPTPAQDSFLRFLAGFRIRIRIRIRIRMDPH
jgi:hypothetical protein